MGNTGRAGLSMCVHVDVVIAMVVVVVVGVGILGGAEAKLANFSEDVEATWSPSKVIIAEGGQQLQLSLDNSSGSGFKSKKEYAFANIEMQIKLVGGDSAGTVVAYYLSSQSPCQDMLEFEFWGNESGQPYTVQTNVLVNGVGGREQRLFLWFDPTTDFHTYQIFWTPRQTLFFVDHIPVRLFNYTVGQPYLDQHAMSVYSSIHNGENWTTGGALTKINWAHAPFVVKYQKFDVKPAPIPPPFDSTKLSWVKQTYMIYDYCLDRTRYPSVPIDCL